MGKGLFKKKKVSRKDFTQSKSTDFTDISATDENLIRDMAEEIVKEAAYHVNPLADAETRTGLEPRYYLKLEIKAFLRAFQRKYKMHLHDINSTDSKDTPDETSLVEYLHRILVDLVEPHFEGGEGTHKIHAKTYIRYVGGPEVTDQIPPCIEKAFDAYKNHTPIEELRPVTPAASQQIVKKAPKATKEKANPFPPIQA